MLERKKILKEWGHPLSSRYCAFKTQGLKLEAKTAKGYSNTHLATIGAEALSQEMPRLSHVTSTCCDCCPLFWPQSDPMIPPCLGWRML